MKAPAPNRLANRSRRSRSAALAGRLSIAGTGAPSRGYLGLAASSAVLLACLTLAALLGASAVPAKAAAAGCFDEAFRTGPSASLPDCRAYEMVTPPLKNGALIHEEELGSVFQIASDGQRVITSTYQCFNNAQSCIAERGSQGVPYEFARTGDGWLSNPLAPPSATFETYSYQSVNASQGTVLYSAPGPGQGQENFYARDSGGTLTNIGPLGEVPNTGNSYFRDVRQLLATSGLSHVVYSTARPYWAFDPTGEGEGNERIGGGRPSLYEYADPGGGVPTDQQQPLLVDVTGGFGSHEPASHCGAFLGSLNLATRGALSEDGRVVYFTTQVAPPPAACPQVTKVYARIDGEAVGARTALLSVPTPGTCTETECLENTSPANELERERNSEFQIASADGSRVIFTSGQQLTDNASESPPLPAVSTGCEGGSGCNLYVSECVHCDELTEQEELADRRLIDISEGAKETGGPRVQGVLGISADGSSVYFVAKGVLTGEAENEHHEKAIDEAENLYLYKEGHLSFIAVLSPSDERDWLRGLANVTPDGRYLVFPSHRALTPDATREEGPAQIFEYDAATATMVRVSVGNEGFNADGNEGQGDATIISPRSANSLANTVPSRPDPTMADDGSVVFFQSPVALTPGALNDVSAGFIFAENVYEYRDGHVFLISDGKDTTGAGGSSGVSSAVELLGSDPAGANVFFTTFDPLVPEDVDTQRDIYDAHVCSEAQPCAAPQLEQAKPCEGESCRGASPPPPGLSPGSAGFDGQGNVRTDRLRAALKRCRKKHGEKRSACERRTRRRFGGAKPKRQAAPTRTTTGGRVGR